MNLRNSGKKQAYFLPVLMFSLPLALTGILQILFNTADMIVVGRYAGSSALAAVGSTSSLINLLVGTFIGTSVGANILAARCLGEENIAKLHRTVSTSILLSAAIGLAVLLLGQVFAGALLVRMGTPTDILPEACLYLRVYFWGAPALLVYNFSAAILRADGDTRHSLAFLVAAGILNVLLNLLFVIAFQAGVIGVAGATVVSQYVSLVLILRLLTKTRSVLRIERRKLRFSRGEAWEIIRYGFPAGLQTTVIQIANVLVQSSVNSFGTVIVAANTASASICGFVYTAMNSVYHAAITFSSREMGSRNYRNLPRILRSCLGAVLVISLPLIAAGVVYAADVLGLYIARDDPARQAVIDHGVMRTWYCLLLYFTCGFMEACCGVVRGMGQAWLPMIMSMIGACGVRILWICTVFRAFHRPEVLYAVFPVSWIITTLLHFACFLILYRRILRDGNRIGVR